MLMYWHGRLYYSDTLVYLATVSIIVIAPIVLALGLHHTDAPLESSRHESSICMDRPDPFDMPGMEQHSCAQQAGVSLLHACPNPATQPQLAESTPRGFGTLLDWLLASTLLTGMLVPWLRWNLLPGWTAGRRSLYALRSASAVVTATALVALVALSVPRNVLLLGTLLCVATTVNGASWLASLWLRLQRDGAARLLPKSVVQVLLHTPPIDLLGKDAPLVLFLTRWWQLCGILLLREDERAEAMTLIPTALRRRLTAEGIQHELPEGLRQLLSPWSRGPPHLRVLPIGEAMSAGSHTADRHALGQESDVSVDPGPEVRRDKREIAASTPAADFQNPHLRPPVGSHSQQPPPPSQQAPCARPPSKQQSQPVLTVQERLCSPPEWLLLFVLRRLIARAFQSYILSDLIPNPFAGLSSRKFRNMLSGKLPSVLPRVVSEKFCGMFGSWHGTPSAQAPAPPAAPAADPNTKGVNVAAAAAATAVALAVLLRCTSMRDVCWLRRLVASRPRLVIVILAVALLLRKLRKQRGYIGYPSPGYPSAGYSSQAGSSYERRSAQGRALLLTVPRVMLAFVPTSVRQRLDLDAILAAGVDLIAKRR